MRPIFQIGRGSTLGFNSLSLCQLNMASMQLRIEKQSEKLNRIVLIIGIIGLFLAFVATIAEWIQALDALNMLNNGSPPIP